MANSIIYSGGEGSWSNTIIYSGPITSANIIYNNKNTNWAIYNNILTINNKDLDNVIKILSKSYYTQNTFKLIK